VCEREPEREGDREGVCVCVREIQRERVCEGDREREETLALARPVAPVAHQLLTQTSTLGNVNFDVSSK
jgi:hypothetical protein